MGTYFLKSYGMNKCHEIECCIGNARGLVKTKFLWRERPPLVSWWNNLKRKCTRSFRQRQNPTSKASKGNLHEKFSILYENIR